MYGTVRIEAATGTMKTPYDRAPPPVTGHLMTEHLMTESPMIEHLMTDNYLTEHFTQSTLIQATLYLPYVLSVVQRLNVMLLSVVTMVDSRSFRHRFPPSKLSTKLALKDLLGMSAGSRPALMSSVARRTR